MNRPEERDLIAKALRDSLSEAEKHEWQQLLESDAELRGRFGEELALDRALEQLPDVKLSSNFTSLAVQAALREPKQRKRWSFPLPWLQPVFARVAAGLIMISVLGISIAHYYRKAERADMALGVRSFTEVASALGNNHAPAAEVFQNFEAIQRLSMPSEGDLDMELLVALQK
jgi:hypothetical protein